MKLKELMPLVGTDEVMVLIPQDTVASESVLSDYLEDVLAHIFHDTT